MGFLSVALCAWFTLTQPTGGSASPSCLLDEFEAQCKSGRIFTSTNLSNVPMQAFLVSRGYVLSGLVQDL
ncbi:MAG: hypothetical protein WA239_16910, partial [Candidatus Sulfotelmatobacter sp.]